jgi:hypothetical protein
MFPSQLGKNAYEAGAVPLSATASGTVESISTARRAMEAVVEFRARMQSRFFHWFKRFFSSPA